MSTLTSEKSLNSAFNRPNPQNCPFCGKLCKNINSYKQHLCRCKNNPDRIPSADRDFKLQYQNLSQEAKDRMKWNKGLTVDTDERVRNYGLVNRGHKNTNYENNVWGEYNETEIQKWFAHIATVEIHIDFDVNITNNYYPTIKGKWGKENNIITNQFVHNYIANQLLNGQLEKYNTVHHIDKNIQNYDKYNLMIFKTSNDHKRYHNSKYAKLVYNQETHLFTCYIDKNNR